MLKYKRNNFSFFKSLQLLQSRWLVECLRFLLLPILGVIVIFGPSAGSQPLYAQDCVSEQNTIMPRIPSLAAAINHAQKLAEQKPWLSGPRCAERAVRDVFGQWLLDWSASIRPDFLPLFFQLISKVENQIGIHRCMERRSSFQPPPVSQRSPVPLPAQAPVMARASQALAA